MGFNKILTEFKAITGKKLVKATYRRELDKRLDVGDGC
jgi:hypothetical protein